MKNLSLIATTLTLILSFSLSLSAQTTATWQGGKPGRTTDWNCAANWLEGKTPDEFTQVIIPFGVDYYPVIKYAVLPIDALLMEGGTLLTLQEDAQLTVLGESGRFGGITIFGIITNNGKLQIGKIIDANLASFQQIQGSGNVISPSVGVDTLVKMY